MDGKRLGKLPYLISNNIVLAIAGIPLGWGIILLVLYVAFKRLNWDWWS